MWSFKKYFIQRFKEGFISFRYKKKDLKNPKQATLQDLKWMYLIIRLKRARPFTIQRLSLVFLFIISANMASKFSSRRILCSHF